MRGLKTRIREIAKQSSNRLIKHVGYYIIKNYASNEIENFFRDLANHGCACGMVGELIYYHDTHRFFDRFYEEIEEIRQEYQWSVGEEVRVSQNDLKNFFAWFGFEEAARSICGQIGLEIW